MIWLALLDEPLKVELTQLPAPEHHSVLISILAVLGTLLWVIFSIYVVWVFKEPLGEFLKALPDKLTKVSIAGFEIELARTPPVELDPGATSFGQMNSEEAASQSYIGTLIQEINGPPVPDSYITINLGDGRKWLTSRLFIFALMFRRMRGVRCFVFVDNSHGVLNEYLGAASTESICWALARRYPWLESAFAAAYDEAISTQGKPLIESDTGRLASYQAADAITKYVEKLKFPLTKGGVPVPPAAAAPPPAAPATPPTPPNPEEWTQLRPDKNVWEHALWIDRSLLHDVLGKVLWTDQLMELSDSKTKVKAIVSLNDPFIAVTKPSGQFLFLIERTRVLKDIAQRTAAQLDEGAKASAK